MRMLFFVGMFPVKIEVTLLKRFYNKRIKLADNHSQLEQKLTIHGNASIFFVFVSRSRAYQKQRAKK